MVEKLDQETQKILDSDAALFEVTHHQDWDAVRQIFIDKILELQNVAEYIDVIQTGNATKLLKEMKANKRAAEILFDILRMIEGGAQQYTEQRTQKKKSFIVREDED